MNNAKEYSLKQLNYKNPLINDYQWQFSKLSSEIARKANLPSISEAVVTANIGGAKMADHHSMKMRLAE